MARNLYLDEVTKDLEIQSNNNLRFTETNSEFVSQKIENKLLFFRREWYLNRELGIPYLAENNIDRDDNTQNIFTKNPDLNYIRSIFVQEIGSVEGVEEILTFDVIFNTANRTYNLDFSVRITTGEIIIQSVEV